MVLLLVFALIALVFSFLCSIFESVLLSIRPSFVKSLESKDHKTSVLLTRLREDISRPLAAILSLNTIANTMGATGVGIQAAVVFDNIPGGVVAGILTLLILVFSEIIPKTLGAMYWRELAKVVAHSINALVIVLLPFVWLSKAISSIVSRGTQENQVSIEEFTALTQIGESEGVFKEQESKIIHNLLRFRTLRVSDIMTPRTVVVAYDTQQTVDELLAEHPKLPFSRIPVYEGRLDDISGYVLKDELLQNQAENKETSKLEDLRLDIYPVPDTMTLLELFGNLLDRHEHIALVVDEYGGFAGIVTMEDIIETLLGLEILDETDRTYDMQALARERWKRRAKQLGLLTEVSVETSAVTEEVGSLRSQAGAGRDDEAKE